MNNNEKILHVLDSFETIQEELKKYRDVLEQRYDFVNQQKSNHMDFILNMNDLKKKLKISYRQRILNREWNI